MAQKIILKAGSLEMNFKQAAGDKSIVYVTHRRCLALISAQSFQSCNKVIHKKETAVVVTKSPECWVNAVRSIGSCHNDHVCSLFQSIHKSQQLRHYATFHLSMCLWREKAVVGPTALQHSTGASTAPKRTDTTAASC